MDLDWLIAYQIAWTQKEVSPTGGAWSTVFPANGNRVAVVASNPTGDDQFVWFGELATSTNSPGMRIETSEVNTSMFRWTYRDFGDWVQQPFRVRSTGAGTSTGWYAEGTVPNHVMRKIRQMSLEMFGA